MATTAAPSPVKSPERREHVTREFGWNVLVWNDPITLMSYVVLVFRRLFGYDLEDWLEAERELTERHQAARLQVMEMAREKSLREDQERISRQCSVTNR